MERNKIIKKTAKSNFTHISLLYTITHIPDIISNYDHFDRLNVLFDIIHFVFVYCAVTFPIFYVMCNVLDVAYPIRLQNDLHCK